MSGTDFRALCAELLAALENAIRVIYNEDGTQHISTADDVIARADAALAHEPVPAPEDGPRSERPLIPSRVLIEQVATDLWNKHCDETVRRVDVDRAEFKEIVKDFCDCLFTYGITATPTPVPVAWLYKCEPDFNGKTWRDNWKATTDHALATFKAAPHDPVPLYPCTVPAPVPHQISSPEIPDSSFDTPAQIGRQGPGEAACPFCGDDADHEPPCDPKAYRPNPAPVPVAERLPGPDDCDADGRCWWGYLPLTGAMGHTPAVWRLTSQGDRFGSEDAWRPYWALPMPASQPEQA